MRMLIAAAAIAAMALVSGCDQEPAHQASAGAPINPPSQPAQTSGTATNGRAATSAANGSAATGAAAASSARGASTANIETAHARRHRHRHAWRMAHYRHGSWHAWNRENRHAYWYGRRMRHTYAYEGEAPYDYVSRSRVYEYGGYGEHRGWHRHVTFAATMTGERLDPWHGYDVDCDRP